VVIPAITNVIGKIMAILQTSSHALRGQFAIVLAKATLVVAWTAVTIVVFLIQGV
jgi:hypothetical protein